MFASFYLSSWQTRTCYCSPLYTHDATSWFPSIFLFRYCLWWILIPFVFFNPVFFWISRCFLLFRLLPTSSFRLPVLHLHKIQRPAGNIPSDLDTSVEALLCCIADYAARPSVILKYVVIWMLLFFKFRKYRKVLVKDRRPFVYLVLQKFKTEGSRS